MEKRERVFASLELGFRTCRASYFFIKKEVRHVNSWVDSLQTVYWTIPGNDFPFFTSKNPRGEYSKKLLKGEYYVEL
jgi:hypothetical protein